MFRMCNSTELDLGGGKADEGRSGIWGTGSLADLRQEIQVKNNSEAEWRKHKAKNMSQDKADKWQPGVKDQGLYTVSVDCLMNHRCAGGLAAGREQLNHVQLSSGSDQDTLTARERERGNAHETQGNRQENTADPDIFCYQKFALCRWSSWLDSCQGFYWVFKWILTACMCLQQKMVGL